jgi:hypothetical protein
MGLNENSKAAILAELEGLSEPSSDLDTVRSMTEERVMIETPVANVPNSTRVKSMHEKNN